MNSKDFKVLFLKLTRFIPRCAISTALRNPLQAILYFELLDFNPENSKNVFTFF